MSTRNYRIAKALAIEYYLSVAENAGDTPALMKDLASKTIIIHPNSIERLAGDLLGFLTFKLHGNARIFVTNPALMEGFGLCRRTIKTIRSRSEVSRHELRGKVQRQESAKNVAEVPMALKKW